jgi:DNA-binding response OmpR family regulator
MFKLDQGAIGHHSNVVFQQANPLEIRLSEPRLLLADDDKQLLNLVTDWLEYQKFNIVTARYGTQCQEFLLTTKYDLLILDWQMPELTGLEICRWFRARGGTTPVLMVSGKMGIDDKEHAFAAGIDDYLTKPFELRELTMRINALLRRTGAANSRILQIGPLTLDPDTHIAKVDGNQLNLTATEFAVLEYMGRHPNQVFSTRTLLDRVWKNATDVSPDTVRVYIKRLREKLHTLGHRDLLQNIHGVGYKFDTPEDCVIKLG